MYIARNPKDVCVSYFHHCRKNTRLNFKGDFSDFAEAFMANQLLFEPFWDHVVQAWMRRSHENLHFMFFEDMKRDAHGELRKLATFLELDLSDEDVQRFEDFPLLVQRGCMTERLLVIGIGSLYASLW